MSNQRQNETRPKAASQTPQRERDRFGAAMDRTDHGMRDMSRTQERAVALSRTTARIHSLLNPDRVLETIGAELRDQGLKCYFGLLDDRTGELVLGHTNLCPEALEATEAIVGMPVAEIRLPADASTHLSAVLRDGETVFEKEVELRIREVVPAPMKGIAFQLAELLQARQAIAAPLVAGSDTLGILAVWSEHLTDEDVPIVTMLAQHAALAIERANLYEDEMRTVFEMEALRKTTLDMTRQLDLPQLLRAIVERAASLVGTKGGGLYLYRPEREELELVVSHNLGADYTGTRLKVGEGLSGRVILTGEPLVIERYSSWQNRSSKYNGTHFGGVLAVPLKWGDKLIGVLNLTDGGSPRSFSDRDLWLMEWFANHATVAIENARLFAERDHKIEQLAALHELTLDILAETDSSHLLLSIVRKAIELLDAQAGAIDLFDPESQQLRMEYSHGYKRDYTGIRLAPGEGVAGIVCQTRQPLAVEDYANWPDRVPQVDKDEIAAALGVPLLRGDELLGVLTIDRRDSPPFSDEDVQLATLFAGQAAIAIENARLYEEQERRSRELLALHETSLHVASRLELRSLLRAIIGRALDLLGGRSGDIYLHRPDTHDLLSAASHQMPAQVEGSVMKSGEGIAGRVMDSRQALIVDDYESWAGRSDTYSGYGFARVIGVPVLYGGELLGVIVVERAKESPRFTETDQNLLDLFAQQAAVAIENSRLFEETRQRAEELEGLYQVSTEVAEQLELPALLNTIVRRAIDLLDALSGSLYLHDPAREDLELIAVQGDTRDRTGIRVARGEGACGKVVQSGEPVVVKGHGRSGGKASQSDDEPIRSALAVPFRQGDTLLGVLLVDDASPERVFDASDVRVATLFANQAAIAIQNARLFAERERTIRQLAALQDVSLQVVSKTDLSEVLPTIVRVAAQLLGARAGAIDLCDPQNEELELTAIYGYKDALIGMKHALGEGVVGRVAQSEQALIVLDYANWDGRSPQWEEQKVGTVLGVPLLRLDQLLGVLTIDRPMSQPFDEGDVKLATLFASQAAIAIQNARTVAATKRRVTELTALREVSLQLTQSLDLATVLDTIVESAVSLVKATDAHIFLYHEDKNEFVFGSGAWAPGQSGSLFKTVRENGLTATVATRGEPVVINEARTHALFRDEVDEDRVVDAIAGFPLKRANQVLGVFNVAFLEPHTFDQDELRVLTLLADQAAIAIENARLYEETDRRLRESQTLQEISRLVNSSLEAEEILQTVVEKLASAFGYSMVSIYTIEGEELRLGAQVGYDPEAVPDSLHLDTGIIGRVARSGEAALVPDVGADPEYLPVVPGIVSEIAVPIQKNHLVLGVLNVESSAATPLTEADLNLVSSMAHQVSVAMQNAELYQAAQQELAERRRAEESYRAVVDHSLQGLAIIQDSRIVFANQAVVEILGYTLDELLALSPEQVRALIHPDDQESVWGRLLDRQSGKPVTARYDCRLVRSDGEVLWVEVFVNATEYQGRPSIQAAVVDITGRKRAQEELHRSYLALTSTLEETVNALAALAEIRDLYTAGHQQRVSRLACAIAERMGLSEEHIQGISMAGLVHDIGKIQIPAEILANPRKLTDLETQMIRTHPQNAYDILCKVDFPWPVADIVLQHHERLDGSGYPKGITKTQILEQARILAVADVVEAMASDRPYRPAHSLEETLEEITGNAGGTYDAEVVHALMTLLRESDFDLASLTTKPPPSEE